MKGSQSHGGTRSRTDRIADTISTALAVLAVVATLALVGAVIAAFVVAFCR